MEVDCDTTLLLLGRKGLTHWREAGYGPGRTTHGSAQRGTSETQRLATDELAEQVGRLRLASSAARREHGKDARRHGASHVVARRSQATRIADDGRGRRRTALRGRGVRREGVAANAVENARLASIGAAADRNLFRRADLSRTRGEGKPSGCRAA